MSLTISQLPDDEHVRLTDLIPIVQDGQTKHATVAKLLAAGETSSLLTQVKGLLAEAESNYDAIEGLATSDFIDGKPNTPEDAKKLIAFYRAAFETTRLAIERIAAAVEDRTR